MEPFPVVRHMLVCEHAEAASHNPRRTNVYGIFSNVFLDATSGHFPFGFGFSLFVMLSDCRRSGTARIVVTEAENADVCYGGVPFHISLQDDPLEVYNLVFRVIQCTIPRAGLYWVELEFEGVVIGQEPFLVKVR